MRCVTFALVGGVLMIGAAPAFAQPPAVQAEIKKLRAEMDQLQNRIKDLEAQLKKTEAARSGGRRGPTGGVTFGSLDPSASKERAERMAKMRAEFEKQGMRFPRGGAAGFGPRDPKQMQEMMDRMKKMRDEFSRTGAGPKKEEKKSDVRPPPGGRGGFRPGFGGATFGSEFGRGGPTTLVPAFRGPQSGADRGLEERLERIIKELEALRTDLKRR